jgi:hypothetical protein
MIGIITKYVRYYSPCFSSNASSISCRSDWPLGKEINPLALRVIVPRGRDVLRCSIIKQTNLSNIDETLVPVCSANSRAFSIISGLTLSVIFFTILLHAMEYV